MTMFDSHAVEIREFKALRQEVDEAVEARDAMTANVALGAIEGIWMHTEGAALREACATFMRTHANHCDFVEFQP